MMEDNIRNELLSKLEIGKDYYFGSTHNGRGFDWSNLGMFTDSMRTDMEIWLEEESNCGYACDVSLCRQSDTLIDFTIYAHQTSPAWYSESILNFSNLTDSLDIKKYYNKCVDEIRFIFVYNNDGVKSSLKLDSSSEVALICHESDEYIYVESKELSPELVEEIKLFLDSFCKQLPIPEDFKLSNIEISDNDLEDEDCYVSESWHDTISINL